MTKKAPALAFEDVGFSYRAIPLFRDLSLSVEEGKVTGIVGPNGCGKSTLLRLAVGLERPSSGSVRVMGRDMSSLSGRQRARAIALLPQTLQSPSITVCDLVACGRYAHQRPFAGLDDGDRRTIRGALEEAGLVDLADRSVRELSGGQRQRAYLAMVLAQEPQVMLLDEPTSALDIRAAHEMLALIRQSALQRGRTACMVVHDLDLALRYCDTVIVLQHGSVVLAGSPDEVTASGALERAFGVDVRDASCDRGRAWSFFPR